MTQEDKELLLKDLCARLPYGVIVKYKSREKEGDVKITCGNIGYVTELGNGWWKECKPYLRPISSMTKEERHELCNIRPCYINSDDIVNGTQCNNFIQASECQDWLNAHHFDYSGLIEKGLAIAVTVENI